MTSRLNQSGLDPHTPSHSPSTTTSTLCSRQIKTVLLQTALSVVQNPSRPKKLVELRLLLDSGSQRSYLTERARNSSSWNQLNTSCCQYLPSDPREEQTKVCPVVNVQMCLKSYAPMSLSLYIVPTICKSLASQPISVCVQQSEAFSGLDLADHSNGKSGLQVDLLIGTDYYWDLVTGSVCRLESGLMAIHTKMGWVLSEPMSNETTVGSTNLVTNTHVLQVGMQPSETESLDERLRSFWELKPWVFKRKKGLFTMTSLPVWYFEMAITGCCYPGKNFMSLCLIITSWAWRG